MRFRLRRFTGRIQLRFRLRRFALRDRLACVRIRFLPFTARARLCRTGICNALSPLFARVCCAPSASHLRHFAIRIQTSRASRIQAGFAIRRLASQIQTGFATYHRAGRIQTVFAIRHRASRIQTGFATRRCAGRIQTVCAIRRLANRIQTVFAIRRLASRIQTGIATCSRAGRSQTGFRFRRFAHRSQPACVSIQRAIRTTGRNRVPRGMLIFRADRNRFCILRRPAALLPGRRPAGRRRIRLSRGTFILPTGLRPLSRTRRLDRSRTAAVRKPFAGIGTGLCRLFCRTCGFLRFAALQRIGRDCASLFSIRPPLGRTFPRTFPGMRRRARNRRFNGASLESPSHSAEQFLDNGFLLHSGGQLYLALLGQFPKLDHRHIVQGLIIHRSPPYRFNACAPRRYLA